MQKFLSLRIILIIVFFFLFILLGFLYFNQERLVFVPSRLPDDFKFSFSTPFIEKTLTLDSGEEINYLIFSPNSSKGIVLYFHGNAGSLKDWGEVGSLLSSKTGWAVCIMDFPGFGKSSADLPKNEKVLLAMGRSIREEITRAKPERPLVLFGRSIGSGIASILASEKHPVGLVLETPYLRFSKLGHEIYPILPEFFSRFDLDNEKSLRSLDLLPTLILHGTADRLIPFEHGKFLATLSPRFSLVSFEGGGHNNLSTFPEYWPRIESFFKNLKFIRYKK
jgi:hypothetical protein